MKLIIRLMFAASLLALSASAALSQPPDANSPLSTVKKMELSDLRGVLGAKYKFEQYKDTDEFEVHLGGQDNWRLYASLSINKEIIWLQFPCQKVPDGMVDGAPVLRLMEENNQMGTAFFALNTKTKLVWLRLPILVRDATPEFVAEKIDFLKQEAIRTAALWNVSNWKATPTEGATK